MFRWLQSQFANPRWARRCKVSPAEPIRQGDWQTESDPRRLLERVSATGRATDRKLQLWACACVRRVWHLLPDERSRTGILVREKYEDRLVTEAEMRAASDAAMMARAEARAPFHKRQNVDDKSPDFAPVWAAGAASTASCGNPYGIEMAARAMACVGPDGWDQSYQMERTVQANLIRHVFGNPFRHIAFPAQWPRSVLMVANALYSGEACAFALHDALLEAGFAEISEHFREPDHPKGCYWLDLILCKS